MTDECRGCAGGWGLADNAHTRDERCNFPDQSPRRLPTMPDPALDLCTCGHVRIDHNNPIGGKCRFPSGCDCLLFERATPPERYERDPVFAPGMVVAAADRDRDDMRTWQVMHTEHRLVFARNFGPDRWLQTRTDLPEGLVVVGDDGRVT